MHEAGVPAGVFNLVIGSGLVAGQASPSTPASTWSPSPAPRPWPADRRPPALAVKQVALELGGKSANVILPSADLARPPNVGVANVMSNSGQTAAPGPACLVHADRYDEAVQLAAEAAAKYGDRIGPVVNAKQQERVRGYIEKGVAEGARVVAGGPEAPREQGYFVSPTVFADVREDMIIAQEEIFGPVLSILRYEDEEDALRIANGTVYGLAGAVWAGDYKEAVAFARRMDTGQVDINGGRFNPLAPPGGYKKSGVGPRTGAARPVREVPPDRMSSSSSSRGVVHVSGCPAPLSVLPSYLP